MLSISVIICKKSYNYDVGSYVAVVFWGQHKDARTVRKIWNKIISNFIKNVFSKFLSQKTRYALCLFQLKIRRTFLSWRSLTNFCQFFLVTIDQILPCLTTFYEISWQKWLTMLIIIMIMVVSDREGVLLLHHPPLSIVLQFQFYVLFEGKKFDATKYKDTLLVTDTSEIDFSSK